MRHGKLLADVAAFAALAVALSTFGYVMADAHTTTGEALPMCESEDSTLCVWPADWQGNGEGESFYSDATGDVTTIEAGKWAYLYEDGTIMVADPPADAAYLP